MSLHDLGDLNVHPKEMLRELMYLVRTGLPARGTFQEQKKRTTEAIAEIRALLESHPELFEEVDVLRLLTLEAEFAQYCGQFEEAARILEPVWTQMKPRLDGWTLRRRLRPKTVDGKTVKSSEIRRLLRQQLWALLHYVFYADYLVAGDHQQALDRLLLLRRIIETELKTKTYTPCGTLAVCHYFIGRCHRVSREFHEAEEHFVLAQRWINERVIRELNQPGITEDRRRYELAFKDVYSARILSGLAWVALQRGGLLRAEQYLRTARALLIDRYQQPLRCFIKLLFWTVVRRRSSYDDPAYYMALTKIEELHGIYVEVKAPTQQRRCAAELLRGYLDLLEFGRCTAKKAQEYVALAEKWLERADTSNSAMPRQRINLHRSRIELLKGHIAGAENAYRDAVAASHSNVRQRGIPIMRAAIEMKKEEWDNAARTLKEELKQLQPFGKKIRPQDNLISDPLMEAQCYVFLAQAHAKRKDYATASHYLGKWQGIGEFVDNYYLHHMAQKVVATGVPYALEFNFRIFAEDSQEIEVTLVERVKDFENWLWDSVQTRYPDLSPEKRGEVLGMSRATASRRLSGKARNQKRA